MRKPAVLALFAATCLALPGAAHAGLSDWAVNPGGRMRIAALSPDADGTVRGAIEIEPSPGWITYWREPGDAGMPPQMTPAPQSGLALEAIDFPPPKLFEQNGVSDIGYDGPVALPFTLAANGGETARSLSANLFIGVCKEICIPFQADLAAALTPAEDEAARAIVEGARQALPQPPSSDFFADRPKVGTDGQTITVPVTLPAFRDMPELYLTGPDGYVYFKPHLQQSGGGRVFATFNANPLPRGYSFSGKTWRLLVISSGRAMETSLVFE